MKYPKTEDLARLINLPPTPILVSGIDMLHLLCGLQLLMRHPQYSKLDGATTVRVFAEELEKRIVQNVPGFKELLAAGWDEAQDVPINQKGETA